MKKFWKWKNQAVLNQETQEETLERTLYLSGQIAEESWFDDEVTPQIFKDELNAGSGDVTVWINSGGGDCVAACIYNMLADYKGKVTVKIDGIAVSAASVIAMAGDKVLMSPVAMVMIHNPSTFAFGEKVDMEKAIAMLDEVKASIINAYERKTNLSRVQIAHMMDAETWMDANKAVQLGFADEIIGDIDPDIPVSNSMYSETVITNSLTSAIAKKCRIGPPAVKQEKPNNTVPADSLMSRLNLMKNWRN